MRSRIARTGRRRWSFAGIVLLVMSATFAVATVAADNAAALAASSEYWTLKAPAASPSARYGVLSAYDATRSQLIAFGGRANDGSYLNDTWSWTGSTWVQVASGGPSGRAHGAMVYDPAIGKIVLFGGYGAAGYLDETWTWDGSAWTKLNITGPSARTGPAATFDMTSNRLILFGGQTGTSTYSNETWSFDGTAWTQLSTASTGTPPSARVGATMSYSAAAANSVLYGGNIGGSVVYDTWTFANGQWTQRNPATTPNIVEYGSSVFDPNSGQVVLFGASTDVTTTWTWSGTNWTPASGGPANLYFMSFAFDPRSGQAVLFGGWNKDATNQTWTWGPTPANTTWTLQSPATSPSARYFAASAYDPATGQLILFGGYNGAPLTDTWSWNGTTWTQLAPSTTPLTSYGATMAYDDATGQLIMFGGRNTAGTATNVTYSWTGSNWVKLNPGTSPSARYTTMTYDPVSQQLMFFGGADDANNLLGDTWAWTGSTWTQLSSTTSPAPRIYNSLVFDPNSGKILLYGGSTSGGASGAVDETWVWSGTTWARLNPATSPGVHYAAHTQTAYDPVIGRVVLFSGTNQSSTFLTDTWIWDGTTWAQIPPLASPAGRYVASTVFDPRKGQFVMFGGYNSTSGYLAQTYTFDITVFTGPALKTSASSLSWASTTLNGYDQYRQTPLSVSVPVPTGNNWNVSLNEFSPLTSGSNTLPKLTVNGSSSNVAATTAPTVTSTGTVPTTTGSVNYPVTVPLAGTAVVYAARYGTGSGTATIPLNVWATVPANAAAGTYTNIITVSTNFGP